MHSTECVTSLWRVQSRAVLSYWSGCPVVTHNSMFIVVSWVFDIITISTTISLSQGQGMVDSSTISGDCTSSCPQDTVTFTSSKEIVRFVGRLACLPVLNVLSLSELMVSNGSVCSTTRGMLEEIIREISFRF